jgi:hypothetical protein
MSIKSKVLAAAATLALVGGVGTAGVLGAGTASAATPSCGPACINLFSYQFGTHTTPTYTVDVLRQGEKTGQPIILFRTANYDPALDWTVSFQGTVADFFAAGPAWSRRRWPCTTAASPGSTSRTARSTSPGSTSPGRRVPTYRRSRTSTRRSAWTRACAWAWPRPRSTTRA